MSPSGVRYAAAGESAHCRVNQWCDGPSRNTRVLRAGRVRRPSPRRGALHGASGPSRPGRRRRGHAQGAWIEGLVSVRGGRPAVGVASVGHYERAGVRRVHLRRRQKAVQLRRQLARCGTRAVALSWCNRCVRLRVWKRCAGVRTVVGIPAPRVRGLAHQWRAHVRARRRGPRLPCSGGGEGRKAVPASCGRDRPATAARARSFSKRSFPGPLSSNGCVFPPPCCGNALRRLGKAFGTSLAPGPLRRGAAASPLRSAAATRAARDEPTAGGWPRPPCRGAPRAAGC